MSNLYDLVPEGEGFQFSNQAGDIYNVYLTNYSLLDPEGVTEDGYVEVYMLGFSCKRFDKTNKSRFDVKTKSTILSIFTGYLNQHPDEGFVYVCDNSDGMARNRSIIFGQWFNETNTVYEHFQSHLNYQGYDWFSALIINKNSPYKAKYVEAYHYTLNQMIGG